MKFLVRFIFVISILIFPTFCFCEENNTPQKQDENNIKIIERETYKVQIKQYDKNYPIVLYVVFKESTPLLDDIRKILKTELLSLAKTEIEPKLNEEKKSKKVEKKKTEKDKENETGLETIKEVVIASAWFDDQVSENLEKIELTKKYGAFVWLYDEKDKTKTFAFDEYLKYLKKKKENFKKKEKLERKKEVNQGIK